MLPGHFLNDTSQEAAQQAIHLQALSRGTIDHIFLDTLLRGNGAVLAPELRAASSKEEGPHGSRSSNSLRGTELNKEASMCASQPAVLPSLRQRASVKGANAGPSELFYLRELQDFPLFAVLVRGSKGFFKFSVFKQSTAALPLQAKLKATRALARVGLTLNQFEASVAAGPEVVLPTGAIPEVGLPYSLRASEIPALFAVVAAAPHGNCETADLDSGVLQLPPPATQRASGSMDDDHDHNGGGDDEHDSSDAENDQQQPRDKRPREGEKKLLRA